MNRPGFFRRLWRGYIRTHAESFYAVWGYNQAISQANKAWVPGHWYSRWYWKQVWREVVNIRDNEKRARHAAQYAFPIKVKREQ